MFKRKLPSGKVQYGRWYVDPLTGKRKRITVAINPSRSKSRDERIAQDELERRISAICDAEGQSTAITLKTLQGKYMTYLQGHVKPQTAISDNAMMSTITRLLGPDTLVSKLRASYIMEKLDAPSGTYNSRIHHLKTCIRWAYRMDMVEDIRYLDKLEMKKGESVREKNSQKYLEHDEIRILLEALPKDRWKLLTEFLILSGLRVGEAIALEDADVADVIRVTKTYSVNIHQVSTTKTATSTREVDVQPELADCIRRIRKFVRAEKLKYGYRSDLFLPNFGGAHIDYTTYRKYLAYHSQKALERKITPHALRHSHVAMLAESGIPLETISRRLGHSDSRVTREVYYHVTEKMRDRDRERLQAVKIL